MKQDKADKIIQRAERKAAKAAKQVEAAGKKAEAAQQKSAAKAEKKAAQVAKRAEQMAAKHNKKAEQATKKAQLAAQKAEEKKAKAAAKTAAKALEGEEGEAGGKKKGKKKLLLILIPVLVAAIGGGAFFFLKGGGEKEPEPLEPIAIPMEYVLNESHITALPVSGTEVLVYQEEIPPEPAAKPEDSAGGEEKEDGEAADEGVEGSGEGGEEAEGSGEEGEEEPPAEEPEEEPGFTKILYRYEGLQDPVSLVSAYAAVMTTKDAGFSYVDETLLRIDPPEEGLAPQGSLLLARNAPKAEDGTGGGVHSLLLSWEGTNCSVTLDMPEGLVHDPKPESAAPSAPRRGLSDLEALHPSKLGLPGDSMDAYKLIPQEGSFRIAGSISTRVNIYGADNQFAGSYFLSADGKLYKLDEAVNGVVELDWE